MKTARELYKKYEGELLNVHLCENAFLDAFDEHDKEIKQLIDEIIEKEKIEIDNLHPALKTRKLMGKY